METKSPVHIIDGVAVAIVGEIGSRRAVDVSRLITLMDYMSGNLTQLTWDEEMQQAVDDVLALLTELVPDFETEGAQS